MKYFRLNNFYVGNNEGVSDSYWDSSLVVQSGDGVYSLGAMEFQDLYYINKEDSEKHDSNEKGINTQDEYIAFADEHWSIDRCKNKKARKLIRRTTRKIGKKVENRKAKIVNKTANKIGYKTIEK